VRKRKKTKRKPRCFSFGETLRRGYCYDTVKGEAVIVMGRLGHEQFLFSFSFIF